jgi:hypothetical protein
MNFGIRYADIPGALASRRKTLTQLSDEMRNFVPTQTEDDVTKREAMRSRLYALNPDREKEPIDKFVENQFDPSHKWTHTFSDRINDLYCSIAFVATAAAELYVNAYLAMKSHELSLTEIFPDLENIDLRKKWLYGPRIFVSNYVLEKGREPYQALIELVNHRNALAHHKVEYHVQEQKVFKGNQFRFELRQMDRWCSLPKELVLNLCQYDTSHIATQVMGMATINN